MPPSIIEALINAPLVSWPRDRQSFQAPSPNSVVTLNDRNGLLEISNQYDREYQLGRESLADIRSRLTAARASNDPAEISRILDEIAPHLDQFGRTARMIQDVHTQNGLNDYSTIENWLNLLYADRRSQPYSDPSQTSTESIRLEGVMLGFGLAGINKHDTSQRLGTAVKLMMEHEARAMASESRWSGTRVLGLWGTNLAVVGVSADQTSAYHQALRTRVLNFFRTNQPLPEDIVRSMGLQHLNTNDLAGRDWLVGNPRNMGLTTGHASVDIPAEDVQPIRADQRVTQALKEMAAAEAEAKRLGRETFTDVVPANSPSRARAERPLARSPRIIPAGTDLADIPALPPQPRGQAPQEATAADVNPRPGHDAGHSIGHQTQLTSLVSQAAGSVPANGGDVTRTHELIDQALQFMDNPEPRQPAVSVESHLEHGRDISLEHYRFEGILRPEFFPQLLHEIAGGRRVFIQQVEIRDMFGHSMDHAPDARDTMLRRTLDITIAGHEYHGLEVYASLKGDEIRIGLIEPPGTRLSDADLARASDYISTNARRIFPNVTHHSVHKVPPLPGGFFDGRGYAIESRTVDGRTERIVHIDGEPLTDAQRGEFISVVQEAHGIRIEPSEIRGVDSIANVAQVERWNGYFRVSEAGRPIYINLPPGTTPPPGFVPGHSPYDITLTPMVEVPAGSPPEVIQMAIERTDRMANEMKSMGINRPNHVSDAQAAAPRLSPDGTGVVVDPRAPRADRAAPLDNQVRLGWIERLQATRGGRVQMNAGMFGLASVITQGSVHLLTGHSQFANPSFYLQMAPDYGLMAAGTAVGETGARASLLARSGELFVRNPETGQRFFNQAAMRTELSGLRGVGVHGAGMLGAVLMMELGHGQLNATQTGRTLVGMTASTLAARGLTYGTLYGLEYAGVLSAPARAAALRSPWTAVGVLAIEAVGLAVNEIYWANRDRAEAERDLRATVGSRMHALDEMIAHNTLTNEDGSVNEAELRRHQTAVRELNDAVCQLMVFQFGQQTEEGRDFVSAQSDLQGARGELNAFLQDYPEIREEIQRQPNQEIAILRRHEERMHDRFASNPFDTRSGYDSSLPHNKLGIIVGKLETAQNDLTRAEPLFRDMVRRRLESAPMTPDPVSLYQSSASLAAGLRSDPVALYNQFFHPEQGYLASRVLYADQVQAQGGDPHYPSPPPPPAYRLVLDPTPVAPLNELGFDPTNFFFRPSPEPGFNPFGLPLTASSDPRVVMISSSSGTPSWARDLNLENDYGTPTPLFELDAQGHLRPISPRPQPADVALTVFPDETIGPLQTNSDVIATDAVTSRPTRPVAMLNGRPVTRLIFGNAPSALIPRR
ncbi:MAG TPA: hypothetical protein VLJ37_01755 [bacterium]|nr:hypothetical protein [bacterium]